jgi:tight adherence protein C
MIGDIYMLGALLLAVISVVCLVVVIRRKARIAYGTQSRFGELLDVEVEMSDTEIRARLEYWCSRLGLGRICTRTGVTLKTLMDQAGIYRPELRVIVHVVYIVLPVILAMLAAGYTLVTGDFAERGLSAAVFGALFGYLLPRYGLRYMAGERNRKLQDEVLIMTHLLKMLFEAGLSIEQALRTVRRQSDLLLPNMCGELDQVIERIDAGMDCPGILTRWAAEVNVREVTDLAEMLAQLQLQGGNIQKRLSAMIVLMEDRARTELREKVGKLSGKMTVVMMLFLFPALMILVAGPGVLSITAALGGLQ